MLISKLNKFTDRHGKAAIIVIALMIVIPFVFMWGPNSIFSDSGPRKLKNAGELYGDEIPIERFIRQVRFAQLQAMQNQRRPLDLNDKRTTEFLADQALQRLQLLHEVKKLGFDDVDESQIDDTVRQSFSVDGKFDRDQYIYFCESLLRSMGLNEGDFREFVKQNIMIGRVYDDVLVDLSVTPEEVEEQLKKNHQQNRVAYRAFMSEDFVEAARQALASEAEVKKILAKIDSENPEKSRDKAVDIVLKLQAKSFYETNIEPLRPWIDGSMGLADVADEYAAAVEAESTEEAMPTPVTPEVFRERLNTYIRPLYQGPTKRLLVARLDVEAFEDKVENVDEQELQRKYEENAAAYAKKVAARHILIRADEKATAEEMKAARTKIEDIREKLLAGGDFAELAKEYSEDPGSAMNGGALGEFARGQMVKPFEDAAFSLGKGGLSEIVETRFGFHLLQVDDVIPAKSFADVRDELLAQVRREKAKRLAWEAADELSYNVFDQADRWGKPKHQVLAKTAAENGYAVATTKYFNQDADELPQIFENSRSAARKALQLNDKQPLSESIEGGDSYFVAALIDARPGSLPQFHDTVKVADICIKQMVDEKALELARAKAAAVRSEIKGAPEATEKNLVANFQFIVPEPFTRLQPPLRNQVGWTLLGQLESQEVGTLSDVLNIGNGAVLVHFIERLPLDEESLTDQDRQVAQEQVHREKMGRLLQEFHARLDAEAEPKLVDNLVDILFR